MGTDHVFPETGPSLGLSLLSCFWLPTEGSRNPHRGLTWFCCAGHYNLLTCVPCGCEIAGPHFWEQNPEPWRKAMLSNSASSAASPVLGPRRWQRIKAQEFLCCAQTVLPEVTPLFSFLFGFSRINFINYRARYNPGVRMGMERAQCCSCPKQTTMETSALG